MDLGVSLIVSFIISMEQDNLGMALGELFVFPTIMTCDGELFAHLQ
jgi:hypothetical protein